MFERYSAVVHHHSPASQPASYNRNVDRCDYNIEKVHLHFLMNLIVRFGLLISNKIRMWQGMWYTLMRKWLIVEWNSLTTIYIFLADILHMRTHWASNYTKIFHIHWIKKKPNQRINDPIFNNIFWTNIGININVEKLEKNVSNGKYC